MSLTVVKRGEMEISDDIERVELEKISSEIDCSAKGVASGKETEQKNVTEAVLITEQIQIEEKLCFNQSKVDSLVEITEEIKLSDDAIRKESKKGLVKKNVS